MTKTDICNLALVKIGNTTITSIDDPNKEEARHCKRCYAQARDELLRAGFWSFATTSVRILPEVTPVDAERVLDAVTAAALGIDDTFTASSVNDGKTWFTNGDADVLGWEATDPTYGAVWFLRVGGTIKFYSTQDVALPELVTQWTAVNGASGSPRITTVLDDQIDGRGKAFARPADFRKLKQITGICGKVDKFAIARANGKVCVITEGEWIRMHYVQLIDTPAEYDADFVAALVTLLASKLARAISGSEEMETTLMQRYERIDLPNARTADGQDSESNENHPLEELLAGDLIGRRGGVLGD